MIFKNCIVIEYIRGDIMYKSRKYILQIIIIIVTAFLLFNIFFYISIRENNKQGFYEVGDNITMQTSNALKVWVDEQTRVVKMISKDQRIVDACRFPQNNEIVYKAQKYLQDLHSLYPYYENLPLSIKLDKKMTKTVNGKEVTINSGEFLIDTVGGKTVGKGGMGYSYIEEIFKGKDYFVSEIYPSILRDNPIFVISAPVIYDSKIIGVAIISPQIDYFTKTFVDSVKFKKTGYLFFVDARGLTIAHPNRKLILNSNQEAKNIGNLVVDRLLRGKNHFEANIYQAPKLYIGRAVNIESEHTPYRWYIVFTQTKNEIFKNSYKFLSIILFMILIITIIVVWALYLVSRINQRELYKDQLEKINVSLEKKVEERTKELRKLAMIDGLTNLFNHQTSYNKLEEEINNAKENDLPLVIIMADLDKFKNVNDTYGHQVGDEVLLTVSDIISDNLKQTHIAGRYGGEEFIIILPNTELDEAITIANRLRISVENQIFQYENLKVTISMGLCKWMGESTIELVGKSDQLLYKAKQNGRNRVEVG